ncbi:MAG TPA: ABC transporter permease [Chloroflexaceae bacterium]|nr:ABC transporter permease [Chloroflexaceae bacterium]
MDDVHNAPAAALGVRPRPTGGRGARLARLAGQNTIGLIGAALIALVVAVALLAPLLAPYGPAELVGRRLLPPSPAHPLGTDELGRDVLSRIVYGARVSLYVGVIAVGLASLLGGALGVVAGYVGGWLDGALTAIIDIMLAFPGLVLAIVIAGLLGPSITNAMIAIGIISTPVYARIARTAVVVIKSELYVDAAHVVGGGSLHIIRRHILPNIAAPLIVQTSLLFSTAVLAEAALSFLGLGIQPPDPSWGSMLNASRRFMETAPWLAIAPGLSIMLVVLGFNFLGDGMRDALDPRLRQV